MPQLRSPGAATNTQCNLNIIIIIIIVIKHGWRFCFFFLAVLGLHCCMQAFSSCSERGLLFVAVHGLLTAVASLVACATRALGVWASVVVARGLSSCGSRTLEHRLSSCGERV